MDTIYIIFGIVFAVLGVLAIVLFCFNVKYLKKRADVERNLPAVPAPQEIQSEDLTLRVKDALIALYDKPEENAVAEETVPEQTEQDGVFIPMIEKLTFSEKYDKLDRYQKSLLDEFVAYVSGKENCEKQLQVSSLAIKYKKTCVVRSVIRRDNVLLQFSILDPDFGRLVREERTGGLKVKPVEVRLNSREALEAAKQTADMTVEYLIGEEAYRLEKRREARREAQRQKREATQS